MKETAYNATAIEDVAGGESFILHCKCTSSPFLGNEHLCQFYFPLLECSCGRGGDSEIDRTNFSLNPTSLSNILRSWQCDFLSTIGIWTADALISAHKADADGMARKMRDWRAANGNTPSNTAGEGMPPRECYGMRTRECSFALKVWSRTCEKVLRSIRDQMEQASHKRRLIIEKPHFLSI